MWKIVYYTGLLLLGCLLGGFVPQKERLVTPESVKRVGVFLSEGLTARQDDLFSAFQTRLLYDLRDVSWFDVSDRDEIGTAVETFHADDPVRYLLSFHGLLSVESFSNDGLRVKVYFPFAEQREESVFRLRSRSGLDSTLSSIKHLLLTRLPLSGEIIALRSDPLTDEERAVVNLGANHDIRQGALYTVMRSNNRSVAILRVEMVHSLAAEMGVLYRDEDLREGDAVLPATADLVAHLNSRFMTVDGRESVTVATAVRIPDMKSRFIRVFLSPYDDAFVVTDDDQTLFVDPVSGRKILLSRGMRLDRLVWKPLSHTVAYASGSDLWVHDVDRDEKIRLVQSDGAPPLFRPVRLVFRQTNRHEVSDFCWSPDGKLFSFFVRTQGLFLFDAGFRFLRRLDLPRLVADASVSLKFREDNRALWIKTPNHFDSYATVSLVSVNSEGGERLLASWEKVLHRPGFVPATDRNGILESSTDEYGRTNLYRLTGRGAGLLRPVFSSIVRPSAGMDSFLSRSSDGAFAVFRNSTDAVLPFPWKGAREAFFFLSSERMAVSGFTADSNKDGVMDWRDLSPVFLTRPGEWKKEEVLVEDCDEFYGFSATGRYLLYRKGDRVFYKKLSNKSEARSAAAP